MDNITASKGGKGCDRGKSFTRGHCCFVVNIIINKKNIIIIIIMMMITIQHTTTQFEIISK